MHHFETSLAKPTVKFCVPDLELIANQDIDLPGLQAIVEMNALVLGVYTHFPNGLAQFRKLTEEDEGVLEADMLQAGAGTPVSVSRPSYVDENEQYYYLRRHYFLHVTRLEASLVDSKQQLEGTQETLTDTKELLIQAEFALHQAQGEWQKQTVQYEEEHELDLTKMQVLPFCDYHQVTALVLKKLKKQHEELREAFDQKDEELQEQQKLSSERDEQLLQKETELNAARNVVAEIHDQGKHHEDQIQEFNSNFETLRLDHNALELRYQANLNVQEEFREDVRQRNETIQALQEDLKKSHNELEKALQDIEQQQESQEAMHTQIEELQAELASVSIAASPSSFAAEATISELRKELSSLHVVLEAKEDIISQTVVTIAIFGGNASSLREKCTDLAQQVNCIADLNVELQGANAQLESNLSRIRRTISEYEQRTVQGNQHRIELEAKIAHLDQTTTTLQARNSSTNQALEQIENEWSAQKALYNKALESQNQLQIQLNSQETREEAQQELYENKLDTREIREISEKYDASILQIASLQDEKADVEKQISILEDKYTKVRDTLKKANIQHSNDEKALKELHDRSHAHTIVVEEELDKMKQELLDLKVRSSDFNHSKMYLTLPKNANEIRDQNDLVVMSAAHAMGMREEQLRKKKI
ncbi:hypothetical protein C8R46DRAFT_1025867 [Mycena filopes]|nr:hypothetical protein C8R46DRAFT_1025867 [Mycena filopes]